MNSYIGIFYFVIQQIRLCTVISTNSWLFFLLLFLVLELYLHRFSFIFLLLLNLPPPSSSSSPPVLLPYSHWTTIFIFFWLLVRNFLENEEFVFINQRIVLADSRNFNILISFLLILYYFLSFLHTFFLQFNMKPVRNIESKYNPKTISSSVSIWSDRELFKLKK